MRRFRHLAAIAVAISLVAACSDDAGGPADPSPPPTNATGPGDDEGSEAVVGELVVAWSEAGHDDLHRLADLRLLADEADRDEFLAEVGPGPDTAPIDAVDMDRHLLVVGSYFQCDEFAEVVASADRTRLWFQVVQPDPGVDCVWAPLQVEVHQVERNLVADDVALDEEPVYVRRPE